MKYKKETLILLILVSILGVTSMNACGFLGFGTEKWKEEVQLSNGRTIIVDREILRESGGMEWASNRSLSKPKEYRIHFPHQDGSGKMIEWRSTKKYGTWPEIPLVLDLESDHPIVYAIVGIRDHCEKYSKYTYQNGAWNEVALPEMFDKRATNLFLRLGVDMPK